MKFLIAIIAAMLVVFGFGLRIIVDQKASISALKEELKSASEHAEAMEEQVLYIQAEVSKRSSVNGCYRTIEIMCEDNISAEKRPKCRNDFSYICTELNDE